MPAEEHSSFVILRTSDEDVRRISTIDVCRQITLRAALILLIGLACTSFAMANRSSDSKSLQVYFIDVEGGQATLFVTPDGQSLLIDTGWPGNNFRDADRIVAAAHDAGINKLDYVLITHYHDDHVGGAPQLAERIPIGTFIDHGENREPDGDFSKKVFATYQQLLATGKYQHLVSKPGDRLPIQGMNVKVVSSDGAVLQESLPGQGQFNPACSAPAPPADNTENARSLGVFITFGDPKSSRFALTILDLGDLTADKERELMCPVNKLGHADVYIASHHGLFQSGSALLVHTIKPRLAIVDNGAKKGGSPAALDIIKSSPGLLALWQLHFSEEAGLAHNTGPEFIANPDGPDAAHYLKLTANPDGTFSIFNSRTKESKQY
jgi:competence protein ComEC